MRTYENGHYAIWVRHNIIWGAALAPWVTIFAWWFS